MKINKPEPEKAVEPVRSELDINVDKMLAYEIYSIRNMNRSHRKALIKTHKVRTDLKDFGEITGVLKYRPPRGKTMRMSIWDSGYKVGEVYKGYVLGKCKFDLLLFDDAKLKNDTFVVFVYELTKYVSPH